MPVNRMAEKAPTATPSLNTNPVLIKGRKNALKRGKHRIILPQTVDLHLPISSSIGFPHLGFESILRPSSSCNHCERVCFLNWRSSNLSPKDRIRNSLTQNGCNKDENDRTVPNQGSKIKSLLGSRTLILFGRSFRGITSPFVLLIRHHNTF